MKNFVIIICIFFPLVSFGQNMVANGSFEDHSNCPTDFNEVPYAIGWRNCSENNDGYHHTDYLNSCGGNNGYYYFTVPANVWGYQFAATGDAYIAMATTALNLYPDYRENVFKKLSTPLSIGSQYYVSLNVSKSNVTYYYTNNIGMKFSTDSIFAIDNICQVNYPNLIEDTSGWITIQGSFTADSAYEYVAVGNFFTDANTMIVADTGCSTCYQIPSIYLIDDICVKDKSEGNCSFSTIISEPGYDDVEVNVFQIPFKNKVQIEITNPNHLSFNLWVMNELGQPLGSQENSTMQDKSEIIYPMNNSPSGLYFVKININSLSVGKKFIYEN